MAMDIGRLAADLTSKFEARWRNRPAGTNAPNKDFFLNGLAIDIATAVINEITGHARCNGLDSNGDTHGNVGIV